MRREIIDDHDLARVKIGLAIPDSELGFVINRNPQFQVFMAGHRRGKVIVAVVKQPNAERKFGTGKGL
jgi:hypothetical protein